MNAVSPSRRLAETVPELRCVGVLVIVFIALALSGCASPHRSAITEHELRTYQGRADGLVALETWRDLEKGGGWFLLTDPSVTGLAAIHTNQTALGGGSQFLTGTAAITVDPQSGAIIGAVGTAAGNIIGAALKSAVK